MQDHCQFPTLGNTIALSDELSLGYVFRPLTLLVNNSVTNKKLLKHFQRLININKFLRAIQIRTCTSFFHEGVGDNIYEPARIMIQVNEHAHLVHFYGNSVNSKWTINSKDLTVFAP